MNTVLVVVALCEGILAILIASSVETRLRELEERYERDHGLEDDPTDPRLMQ